MSDPDILTRLIGQLAAKGMDASEARRVAIGHLEKSGILRKGSLQLTDRGQVRNDMTPAQRAKDRASKYSGGLHTPSAYKYDPKTNLATLKQAPAVKVHAPHRPRSKR